MGIKSCGEILEAHKEWDFLQQLPENLLGFKLTKPLALQELELIFARYTDGGNRMLELVYTQETGDYVVVKSVGLFRFRDDRYYFREDKKFADEVAVHLQELLTDLVGSGQRFPAEVFGLPFAGWQDWRTLPEQVGEFRRVISPERPLKYINGSWIIFAYENLTQGHQLAIFYNEFRNEVFGELKRHGVFEATGAFSLSFDGDNYQHKPEQFLPDVTVMIGKNLEKTLEELNF